MKVNHIFMISIVGGVSLPATMSVIAGGDGEQGIVITSPNPRKRLSQLFHRSSSSLMSASSDSSSNRNSGSSFSIGSLDSTDSNGSSSSQSSKKTRAKTMKALKKFLSRSSRATDSSSSSSISQQVSRRPVNITPMTYADVIDRAALALLGLTGAASEVFLDGDSDIKGMSEIDGFIARFENVQHKLNTYYRRAEPHFAVSYMKTLSHNFARVARVHPLDIYKYLAKIYPTYLGVTVEDGIKLSCAECTALLAKREHDHPEEKDLSRQIEYLIRNSITKQEWDTILQEGGQGLIKLKIKPEDTAHYLYLITLTNEMRLELSEFKKNNPTSVQSAASQQSSTPDLSKQAFSLDD